MIASTVDLPADAPAPSTAESCHTLCRWVYLGSHNLSGAAWGVREGGAEFSSACYRLIAWELGVVIIPPAPELFPLPFTSNYNQYDLAAEPPDVPVKDSEITIHALCFRDFALNFDHTENLRVFQWGSAHINERLAGSGGAEKAARADVARSVDAMADCCGTAPVTVLKDLTFGELIGLTDRAAAQQLPRLLMFVDLQATGKGKQRHDEAVLAFWQALCRLGSLVDQNFGGCWVGGVDEMGKHCSLVARDMGIANSAAIHPSTTRPDCAAFQLADLQTYVKRFGLRPSGKAIMVRRLDEIFDSMLAEAAAGNGKRQEQLPSVRVVFGSQALLELDGVNQVNAFAAMDTAAVGTQLSEAAGRVTTIVAVDTARALEWQTQKMQSQHVMAKNGAWVRQRYKVIVLDTEGCLKKPGVKTIAKGRKYDSFYEHCLPFFGALLLPADAFEAMMTQQAVHDCDICGSRILGDRHTKDVARGSYDLCSNCFGLQPAEKQASLTLVPAAAAAAAAHPMPPVARRADSPLLCIVSNVGVEQTDQQWNAHGGGGASGGAASKSSLSEPGSARTIIGAALVRLAAELGLLPEYHTACAKAGGRVLDCFSAVRMIELKLALLAEQRLNVCR